MKVKLQQPYFAMGISMAIFNVMLFIFFIISVISKFRLGPVEGVKLAALYFIFLVISTIIIALKIG
jgi:Ca2+/Na+ antiporter